jgi:hypothetical protein
LIAEIKNRISRKAITATTSRAAVIGVLSSGGPRS